MSAAAAPDPVKQASAAFNRVFQGNIKGLGCFATPDPVLIQTIAAPFLAVTSGNGIRQHSPKPDEWLQERLP